VSHYLGGLATVLGRFDEADAYFVRASELNRRMGAKFFAARTELLWARMLVERGAPGDRSRAEALLTSARDAAGAGSYGVIHRRAEATLAGLAGGDGGPVPD
jgi:ATP/maltotriose-dependent transcriptional regulator MalT